jgi:8-hydroxy-5-deazaflavin:NADPH oxidoreductase
MSSISIIGAGTMARTVAARALAGGNTVEVISRDAAKAAALSAPSSPAPMATGSTARPASTTESPETRQEKQS